MIIPIIIKTPSIPMPIYLSEWMKFEGLNSIPSLLYMKNPRTNAPAITEAICPETLTPIECIRRKF